MQINGTWNTHSLSVLLLFAACESYLPSHTLHLQKWLTTSGTHFLLSGFTVSSMEGKYGGWASTKPFSKASELLCQGIVSDTLHYNIEYKNECYIIYLLHIVSIT